MGTLSPPSAWTMLHLLLSSSLLALATAEADPQLLYGAGSLPYFGATVGAVAHVPVVKSDVVTPAEVEHEVTAHTVPVAVGYHGLGHFGYYGKRSADAAVLGGASRVVSAPTPLIHNPPALPVAYAHPLGYAGLPYAGLPYAGLPYAAASATFAPVGAVAKSVVVKSDVITPAELATKSLLTPFPWLLDTTAFLIGVKCVLLLVSGPGDWRSLSLF